MTDLRQAAQQALEALLWADAQGENWQQVVKKAIKPIQEAAAQPEPVQEPFGYLWPTGSHPEFRFTQQKRDGADGMPLYTAPPQQQAEPVHGDIRALKYRIHELEGEVMGYKRMLDVAEAASQRKPLTDEEIKELWVVYRAALPRYLCFARAVEAATVSRRGHDL